jgi:hypothetical protein
MVTIDPEISAQIYTQEKLKHMSEHQIRLK